MFRIVVIVLMGLSLLAYSPSEPGGPRVVIDVDQPTFHGSAIAGAPIPRRASKALLYFPTRVGTKLVYGRPAGDNSGHDSTETITAVEEKDGRYLVTVATSSSGLEPELAKYLVSADGVFCTALAVETETERVDHDPPYCLLKLPYCRGKKWGDPESPGGVSTVVGIETVNVPAGTFEVIRVDRRVTAGGIHPGVYSYWYAPGLGVVKMKVNDTIIHMKSFSLPK